MKENTLQSALKVLEMASQSSRGPLHEACEIAMQGKGEGLSAGLIFRPHEPGQIL